MPLISSTLPLAAWVPGFWELTLLLLVFVLLFGAKKLPELARSMGSSVTQFKRGLKSESDALEEGPVDETTSQGATSQGSAGEPK